MNLAFFSKKFQISWILSWVLDFWRKQFRHSFCVGLQTLKVSHHFYLNCLTEGTLFSLVLIWNVHARIHGTFNFYDNDNKLLLQENYLEKRFKLSRICGGKILVTPSKKKNILVTSPKKDHHFLNQRGKGSMSCFENWINQEWEKARIKKT